MTSTDTFINKTRHVLFNTTGPRYDLIMPAFGPLANSLVKLADLQPGERVLDLGTGTGAVAFPAGQTAKQVSGIDYAPTMLWRGRQHAIQTKAAHISFYQGDMHRLPHADATFQVALASFGLNGIDPSQVFSQVWRVLQSGGRLLFQEWGDVDEASKLIKQTIQAHSVEQAEGLLANLRRLSETPRAWDQVNGPGAIAEMLRESGFRWVKTIVEHEAIPLEPVTFFLYKTAWTPYQAELEAMSSTARAAVKAEVIDKLSSWTEANGHFIWKPELHRVIAWK
jgi:ubiquinone/menaquinone biosynthesis C-methylase UbiE